VNISILAIPLGIIILDEFFDFSIIQWFQVVYIIVFILWLTWDIGIEKIINHQSKIKNNET
jgi:hypothetical protein